MFWEALDRNTQEVREGGDEVWNWTHEVGRETEKGDTCVCGATVKARVDTRNEGETDLTEMSEPDGLFHK